MILYKSFFTQNRPLRSQIIGYSKFCVKIDSMNTPKEEQMDIFIDEYNLLFNVPAHKANRDVCEQYRKEHPSEFKSSGWSIVKHRKKLMDWFSRQNRETLKVLTEE